MKGPRLHPFRTICDVDVKLIYDLGMFLEAAKVRSSFVSVYL